MTTPMQGGLNDVGGGITETQKGVGHQRAKREENAVHRGWGGGGCIVDRDQSFAPYVV